MGSALTVLKQNLAPHEAIITGLLEPVGMSPSRILASAAVAYDASPKIRECSMSSVVNSIITGCVLGLESDGYIGQGFLLPFKRKCQFVIGYKGFNTLAARSGFAIHGAIVREGDSFDYELGTDAFVRHKPLLGGEADRKIVAAWSLGKHQDGTQLSPVILSLDELMAVKARSPAGASSFSPWNDAAIGFPAMCEKTAKRRLARTVPLSLNTPTPINQYHAGAVLDTLQEEVGKVAWLQPDGIPEIGGDAATISRGDPGDVTTVPSWRVEWGNGEFKECDSLTMWSAFMGRAIDRIADGSTLAEFRHANDKTIQEIKDSNKKGRDVAVDVELRFTEKHVALTPE